MPVQGTAKELELLQALDEAKQMIALLIFSSGGAFTVTPAGELFAKKLNLLKIERPEGWVYRVEIITP